MIAATLVDLRWVAMVGFVVAGLGNATIVPKIYDQAARYPGQAGRGLGALSAGLRISLLLTPVIVGSLADTSLSVGSAMAIVALPSVVGVLLATLALPSSGQQTPHAAQPGRV